MSRTISVALNIENRKIMERVTRLFPSIGSVGEISITEFAPLSQVVICDYDDPMSSLPLIEQKNKAQGKPLVVIIFKKDPLLIRQLFLDGASDVLAIDDIEKDMVFAIRNAHDSQAAATRESQLLTTGLVHFRDLSELAGAGSDLQPFFNRIVEVIARIMEVEIVSLMLLNERFQTLWIASAIGLDQQIIKETSVSLGQGISGRVAKQGRPLLLQNVEQEMDYQKRKSSTKYSTKGLLSVPIKVRNQVIGVFNVNNKISGGSFHESDLNILVTLSNQAGLAIDNARMFSDLKSKASSLEIAYNELKKLNRAKTDLVMNLSHEMKTPLTAILGYVDLMLSGQIKQKERITGALEKISQRGKHLNRLVERIFTYFALQTNSINWMFEMTPLVKIIYQAVDDLRELARKKEVEVFVDGPSLAYHIHCDVPHMREVFANLVENAIIFNKKGGKVKIDGQTDGMGVRAVKINVRDTGPGISQSIVNTIFDGFVQTENVMMEKPEGLGIGLAMSKVIVEDHFGSIKLSANSKKGAVFTINLPLKVNTRLNRPARKFVPAQI